MSAYSAYSAEIDLTPFLESRVAVFLADPLMKKHTTLTLKHMGFKNAEFYDVPTNYFDALNRIVPIVAGEAELVLMNLPPKPYSQKKKEELITIYEMVDDNYMDLKALVNKRKVDPLKVLCKAIPLIEVGDYLREKLIEVLVKYRVPSAFFMTAPMAIKKSETAARKEWKAKKNLELFYMELSRYLNYYFRDKDELIALVDDKLNEQELSERKQQYDQLVAQADECKEKGDIDTAVNLLRQAIEVFPQDIEAFLESGRLYVRKREYGRALIRYGQAEDLFQEAPEPNKEIGNLRLTQVKEKVKAGAAPDSPEVMELLNEAVQQFQEAIGKAEQLEQNYDNNKKIIQHESVTSIASSILQWNLGPLLGQKHPAVAELLGVVRDSTAKLDSASLDELTGSQCLALALRAFQKGDLTTAETYYFRALDDPDYFIDAATEINKMGMRLRKKGLLDEALEVYEKLLKYNPPNEGSVYMNMALACTLKKNDVDAAGYVSRCLYCDPELAKEKVFYESLIPEIIPLMLKLFKIIRLIQENSKTVKPSPQLLKLINVSQHLRKMIQNNKRGDALKLFIQLYKKAPRFLINPEFYGDGEVTKFLQEIRGPMAGNPKYKDTLVVINNWLKHVSQHPAPPRFDQFSQLLKGAESAMDVSGENHLAAFYVGKALIIMPESYYQSPYFYSNRQLLFLVRELYYKFRYVNPQAFPKRKRVSPPAQPQSAGSTG